jgi:hypothetical protein
VNWKGKPDMLHLTREVTSLRLECFSVKWAFMHRHEFSSPGIIAF